MYVFGGVLENGNINEELQILCFIPIGRGSTDYKLEWKACSELECKPKGKPP